MIHTVTKWSTPLRSSFKSHHRNRSTNTGRQNHGWSSQTSFDNLPYLLLVSGSLIAFLQTGTSSGDSESFPHEFQLMQALKRDDVDTVARFVEDAFTSDKHKALVGNLVLLSASYGSLDTIAYLKDIGLDLQYEDSEGTNALLYAAVSDNHKSVQMIEWLIQHGLTLNQKNHNGMGPVLMAAMGGNVDVIKYLIEEKGLAFHDRNNQGSTPLHIAAIYHRSEVIKYLISAGADINDFQNKDKVAPIIAAVSDTACLRTLIEGGADVNFQTPTGVTSLMLASAESSEAVDILLNANADVNMRDQYNVNAAYYAVHGKKLDILKKLVEYGIDLTVQDMEQKSLLVYSCSSVPILKYLKEQGFPLNTKDSTGNTLLHVAAEQDQVESVEFLLQEGIDVESREDLGSTPLIHASITGSYRTAEKLLENGANINGANEAGVTPLIVASYFCHPEVVELYLNNNADTTITDLDFKRTAYDWAVYNDCPRAVNYIARRSQVKN